MFNWLYNGLARAILRQIDNPLVAEKVQQLALETLQDEEVQKQVVMFGDVLYDRYKKKTLGTLGTMQQKVNKVTAPSQMGLAGMIGKDGSINLGGLIANFLLGSQQPQSSSRLP